MNIEEIYDKAERVAALLNINYTVRRWESGNVQCCKLGDIFSAACLYMCSVPDTEFLDEVIDDDPDISLPFPYLVDALRCYNGGMSLNVARFKPSKDRWAVCQNRHNPGHQQACLSVLRDVQQAAKKFDSVYLVPIDTATVLIWCSDQELIKRVDQFYDNCVPGFAPQSEPQKKSAEPKGDKTDLLHRISTASGGTLSHEEQIHLRDLFAAQCKQNRIPDILQMVSQLSASLLPVVDLVRLFIVRPNISWSALAPYASLIQQDGYDPNKTAIQLRQLIQSWPNAHQMQVNSLVKAQQEAKARYEGYGTDLLLKELWGGVQNEIDKDWLDVQNEIDEDWLRAKVTELRKISTAAAVDFLKLCRPLYDQLSYSTASSQMSELYVLPAERRLAHRNEFIQKKIRENDENAMTTCWEDQTRKAFKIIKQQLATLETVPSSSKPPLNASAEVEEYFAALFPGLNALDVHKVLHDASTQAADPGLHSLPDKQSQAINRLTAEFDRNFSEVEGTIAPEKRASGRDIANAWHALLGPYDEDRDDTPAFLSSDSDLPLIASVWRLISAYPQFAKRSPTLAHLSEHEVKSEQREMVHSFFTTASQCTDEKRQGRVCGMRQEHQFCRVLQGPWRFFEGVLDDGTPMQRFIHLTDQFTSYDPTPREVEELYADLMEKKMPPEVAQWYRDNLHRHCVQSGWPLPASLQGHIRHRMT